MNEQGRILQHYLLNWNYISAHLNTPQPPPCPSHTFISDAHGSLTTIDHILCPQHLLPQRVKCHPLDEDPLNTSDHLPLICHLNLDLHSQLSPKTKPTSHPKPNWKKVSTQEIHDTYNKAVEAALGPIALPTLSALSSNPLEIDFHLDQLTSVLTRIALSTILRGDQNFQVRTVLAGCFWGDQNFQGRTDFTRKYGPRDHFFQQKFWSPDQFFQDQNSSDRLVRSENEARILYTVEKRLYFAV